MVGGVAEREGGCMKCQNVQIGESLHHSIMEAAFRKWPIFSKRSTIMIEWSTKRRIYIPVLEGDWGARYVSENDPLLIPYPSPSFGTAGFEPIDILGLPHNVQLDYNEIADILLIALRPGGKA